MGARPQGAEQYRASVTPVYVLYSERFIVAQICWSTRNACWRLALCLMHEQSSVHCR